MHLIRISGASAPSALEVLRAARVRRRLNVSNAVAAVLADIAFGGGQRDHDMMLFSLTADRCGAEAGVR